MENDREDQLSTAHTIHDLKLGLDWITQRVLKHRYNRDSDSRIW